MQIKTMGPLRQITRWPHRVRNLLTVVVIFNAISIIQAEAGSYTHYRLPASIQPLRYVLKIITPLDNADNLTFSGSVAIHFQVLEDATNITLHARNLSIDDSRIQLTSNEEGNFNICLDQVETVPEHDYYIVQLCQTLSKDKVYEIVLNFSGNLNNEFQGYFATSYVDETTNETKWITGTQFEPTWARNAFPCMDEPNYKANFTIWLGHNKSMAAISNMPLDRQIPLEDMDGFVWSIFEESVPMSSYLVAYSVLDFVYKESKIEGSKVVFRTWCRKDYIDQCEYGAEVAPTVLKFYEDMFEIPFPLQKVDQIAIPGFLSIAMENWGLIIYSEGIFLFEPNVTTLMQKTPVTGCIAHELAHQWFGNLVTMKWWTDLWLNEGFATYVSSLGVHHLNPELDSYNIYSLDNLLEVMETDSKSNSHPVSKLVWNTSKILDRFDSISYAKGSVVLRMMHLTVGHAAFFGAIGEYLTKHEFQNAEQDELWSEFTAKGHHFRSIRPEYDMKTIMDTWTLYTGFPLVKVHRNYETGSLQISQERFLRNKVNATSEESKVCWWVPLSFTTASELDFNTTTPKAWLECDESGKGIALSINHAASANEWFIFNLQLAGFYRVSYDDGNWRLLQKALNSDQFVNIHVMNRAQIVGDALALAFSGYQDYDMALSILEYLTREHEYLPWKIALDDLSEIYSMVKYFPKEIAYFKTYMQYILEPIYYRMGGLNDTYGIDGEPTHSQMLLKNLVTDWACRLELYDCTNSAIKYFEQWKMAEHPDEENPIPTDLRTTVYCTAIKYGDADDWKFLWRRYKKNPAKEVEMATVIAALGCSLNKTLLSEYITALFTEDTEIWENDVTLGFDTIATDETGLTVAWEYLIVNIEALHVAHQEIDYMADTISDQIISSAQLAKHINFINTNKERFKDAEVRVKYAHGNANPRIHWVEHNLEKIISQIQSRLSSMGMIFSNTMKMQ
ncbi:aminopeptidase N [Stomoxys calcitrans]|uniref:Aminopeptidase n=1 Tax=Stomoxys calcitrans TaxID=35570 RepID=A0A1I8NXT7_STOCA|nr:aminopeptidase N [Stomoxys calcitrans]